ncbi:MAG TPA: GldG family protein [Candidatus Enterenecus avicola]|nr:GldG family protein [Candidatus Enterenecus avicola]
MKQVLENWKASLHAPHQALQGGGYSLVLTAVVLAILVVLNVLVSALPTTLTKYDMSATQLYSITSNTKVVVNALEEDVTIYWVVQSGEENDVIENLLDKYESLSDHIKVVKKNPDVYPTFTQQYTDETVSNNSLIVECGDRSRYVPYEDIYVQELDVYTYSTTTSFDGEGAITSAIDYVVSDELPKLYFVEGHGEADLPAGFTEQIEKENMETDTLSLLTVDEIPEDADCLVIYGPTSDISTQERDLLSDYTQNGGKLLVMAGSTQDGTLTNLYTLLEEYGVKPVDGIVVEQDREHYAIGYPYLVMPELSSHDITDALVEEGYHPIFSLAQGLTTSESTSSAVTTLLTTSDTSFSKAAGFDLTTYEKEEGDTDGPFALGVSIDTGNDGQMVWFSSSDYLTDVCNAYSSGANLDLTMNALADLIGEREAIAIRSKSLDYNYLTISDSVASLLKTVMIGVFPLVYLGVGIGVMVRRKQVQHEAV